MKLYYAPRTRATRPRWLLEELGVPYELVRVDMRSKEHKSPDHLARHPHGAVPVLEDGEVTCFESGAIVAFLADKFLDRGLAPEHGTVARAIYYQWLFYAANEVEPPILEHSMHTRVLPEDKRRPDAAAAALDRLARVTRTLEATLAERLFLLGDTFSAADVLLGSMVIWGKATGLFAESPHLGAYADGLKARPAYLRATSD